jgi:hypothetical protein
MKHETFGERQRRRSSDRIDQLAQVLLALCMISAAMAALAQLVIEKSITG